MRMKINWTASCKQTLGHLLASSRRSERVSTNNKIKHMAPFCIYFYLNFYIHIQNLAVVFIKFILYCIYRTQRYLYNNNNNYFHVIKYQIWLKKINKHTAVAVAAVA